MANINRVVLVGNLTRDPELRHTPSGMAVCSLRIAVNTRRKDATSGESLFPPLDARSTRKGIMSPGPIGSRVDALADPQERSAGAV